VHVVLIRKDTALMNLMRGLLAECAYYQMRPTCVQICEAYYDGDRISFLIGSPASPSTHKLKSFLHDRTLLPRHPHFHPKRQESVTHVSGTICTYVSGRSAGDRRTRHIDRRVFAGNRAALSNLSSLQIATANLKATVPLPSFLRLSFVNLI
jgi:hypothetical protein